MLITLISCGDGGRISIANGFHQTGASGSMQKANTCISYGSLIFPASIYMKSCRNGKELVEQMDGISKWLYWVSQKTNTCMSPGLSSCLSCALHPLSSSCVSLC